MVSRSGEKFDKLTGDLHDDTVKESIRKPIVALGDFAVRLQQVKAH